MSARVDHSRIEYPSQRVMLQDLRRLDPISYRILMGEHSHDQARAEDREPLPLKRLLGHEQGVASDHARYITEHIGPGPTSRVKDRLAEMYVRWGLAASEPEGRTLARSIEEQVESQLGYSLDEEIANLPHNRRSSPPASSR